MCDSMNIMKCPICNSDMVINDKRMRLSGMRIQYRCPKCGKTKMVKDERINNINEKLSGR